MAPRSRSRCHTQGASRAPGPLALGPAVPRSAGRDDARHDDEHHQEDDGGHDANDDLLGGQPEHRPLPTAVLAAPIAQPGPDDEQHRAGDHGPADRGEVAVAHCRQIQRTAQAAATIMMTTTTTVAANDSSSALTSAPRSATRGLTTLWSGLAVRALLTHPVAILGSLALPTR